MFFFFLIYRTNNLRKNKKCDHLYCELLSWNCSIKLGNPSGNCISSSHFLFHVFILATILHVVVVEEAILKGSKSEPPRLNGADIEMKNHQV